MHKYPILLLFLTCLLFPQSAYSQASVNVGYVGSYSGMDNFNALLDNFDKQKPWLNESLGNIRFINGMLLGLGYRWEDFRLTAVYTMRFRLAKASGVDPIDENTFERELSFRLNGYSLAAEYFIGFLSYGTRIDYDRLVFHDKKTDTSISSEYGWSNRFYLGINSDNSSGLQVSLQPFVKIYWKRFDLTALADWLEVNDPTIPRAQKMLLFGITVLFTNG